MNQKMNLEDMCRDDASSDKTDEWVPEGNDQGPIEIKKLQEELKQDEGKTHSPNYLMRLKKDSTKNVVPQGVDEFPGNEMAFED
eukprot:CAMPEP_0170489922 /NCGR_PEP_ID=MMETSP0208-20121228/8216_1 /TAXON_ID=197538 /ORGANISM="Strombidium inclinatum, Strain S3" /LENGTH=83 /DNA_ID=CAMNT_0010765081 /DNA_START=58 /DNA_END=309 /DNA_ORIENTATION=+